MIGMNSVRPKTSRAAGAILFAAALAFNGLRPETAAAQEPAESGLFLTVQNPINNATITNLQSRIDRKRGVPGEKLRKVIFDFNPSDGEAATTSFGACSDLADLIQNLKNNGITTIAFVHGKTTRHSVLPVLSCAEVVMSSDARLGKVVEGNEVLDEEKVRVYRRFAGPDCEAAVMKMIDKNVAVVLGRKGENRVYVEASKVGRKDFDIAVNPADLQKPVVPKGDTALYTTAEAIKFNLCQHVLETRDAVVEHYQLRPGDLRDDINSKIKAVKIELAGPIDESFRQKLRGQLQEVRSRKENTVFFVLECGGGNAKVAREVADEIRELVNDEKVPVRTIAFIPNKAPDLAALIAFACSEIVMFKGSDPNAEATLGDFEDFFRSAAKDPANTPDFISKNLGEIALFRDYPKQIAEAMANRDQTLYYVRDRTTGKHELMAGDVLEKAQNGNNKKYDVVKTLKQPGKYLVLTASMAREYRVAQQTVDNKDVREVYSLYGIPEKEVRDSKPGWLDDFAAFVRRTEVSILLIIIAFAGLILEFKMPGATIPGLVALVCFVLFFWAHAYANGQTIYLAIALFVLGLILLGVEIFILPGFGVTGISGVLLILAGVGLATLEKAPSSPDEWALFASRLLQYGLTLVASGAIVAVVARYLPKIPYANRLMLAPPSENPELGDDLPLLPGAEQAAALLGQVGVATSMLRPAGMAKIGDQYVDVVTEGDFIEPGTPIQVIEVEGTRIVVKKV
jgi:membrane-bound serine protease (ClpP class)